MSRSQPSSSWGLWGPFTEGPSRGGLEMVGDGALCPSTAQPSSAHHSPAQPNPAQPSSAQPSPALLWISLEQTQGELPDCCRTGPCVPKGSLVPKGPCVPKGRDPPASLGSQPEICSPCSFLLFIPQKVQLGLVFKPHEFLILSPTPVPWECSVQQPDFPVPLRVLQNDRATLDTFPGHLKPFITKCSRAPW